MSKSAKPSKKGAPAKKASKPKPYVQPASQLGTRVLPVTPPLSSAQARRQLRGF